MKYQNTKTGAVIDVKSCITGGNWQALESAMSSEKKATPAQRKTGRKKNG